MKYFFRIFTVIWVVTNMAYAASEATPEQKQEFRNQAVNWIAAMGVCGFKFNQSQIEIYIVKLIGDLKDPLLKAMKIEALEAVNTISGLGAEQKSQTCASLYEEAKPFDIYK